jgi:hypothetical protein
VPVSSLIPHHRNGDAERHQHGERPVQRPAHEPDNCEGRQRYRRRDEVSVGEQWTRHLGAGSEHETDRRGGDAAQHSLQCRDLAEPRIDQRDHRNDDEWRADQPRQRDRGTRRAADASAEYHRQVDDVGAGQELAEGVGVVELFRRHPLALFDEHAP